jgi:hypothetical protein
MRTGTDLAMPLAIALATGATSCYRPDAPAGAPCAAGDTCPAGLVCRGGLCLGPGDDPIDAPIDAPGAVVTWRGNAAGSLDAVMLSEVATASEISGEAGDLYVAVVSVKPALPVTGITGLGATWTPIREQCGGRDTARLAMFWARTAAAATGTVTASLNNGTLFLGAAVLSVHRYSGTDPAAPVGNASWANVNGHDESPACTGGVDTQTYAWRSLDTTAAGALVLVGTHTARYTHSPGPGFTEREDRQSGNTADSAGLAVEERLIDLPSSDVRITGSYSGSPDWSAIAVELRPGGASAP